MVDIDGVRRYITGYSKIADADGEYPAEVEYEFTKQVPLSFLQDLFGIPRNHPEEWGRYMINCFEIHEKEAIALQPFLKDKLDLDMYDFFLESSDKES